VPPTKGAKKPILSSEFRDCIQVDLIDMRAMMKRDIYGNMQHWIMTVKIIQLGWCIFVRFHRRRPFLLLPNWRNILAELVTPKSFTPVCLPLPSC